MESDELYTVKKLIIILLFSTCVIVAQAQTISKKWIEAEYQKQEIPKRDISKQLYGATLATTWICTTTIEIEKTNSYTSLNWKFMGLCAAIGIYYLIDWIIKEKKRTKYY